MKRVMAIDYGRKRVGVAITDPSCTIAQPLVTIRPKSVADLIERLKCIAQENAVGLIIVGNPLSLSGEPTAMSREVERFIEKLRRHIDVRIELWDERFLSRHAVNTLRGSGLKAKKDTIDRVAASIMLDEYLLKNPA